jgi:hypothetical protein
MCGLCISSSIDDIDRIAAAELQLQCQRQESQASAHEQQIADAKTTTESLIDPLRKRLLKMALIKVYCEQIETLKGLHRVERKFKERQQIYELLRFHVNDMCQVAREVNEMCTRAHLPSADMIDINELLRRLDIGSIDNGRRPDDLPDVEVSASSSSSSYGYGKTSHVHGRNYATTFGTIAAMGAI